MTDLKRITGIAALVLMLVFTSGICIAEEAEAPEKKETRLEGVVNINKATAEELKLLPGIGEVTAQAILTYVEEHGEFEAIEDIKKVRGIGDKTFDNLKEFLCIEGDTTLKKKE